MMISFFKTFFFFSRNLSHTRRDLACYFHTLAQTQKLNDWIICCIVFVEMILFGEIRKDQHHRNWSGRVPLMNSLRINHNFLLFFFFWNCSITSLKPISFDSEGMSYASKLEENDNESLSDSGHQSSCYSYYCQDFEDKKKNTVSRYESNLLASEPITPVPIKKVTNNNSNNSSYGFGLQNNWNER